MSWIEVRATVPEGGDLSPFIEIFRTHGIENTQEDGPNLIGCIVAVEGSDSRVEDLRNELLGAGAASVEANPFEEQNWDEVWRQFFKPRRVGERFVVRPTWEEFAAEPDDLVIVLDPGQAFGTGDHPTTRLSLELLEQANVRGKRVADVGCGSGILAIGACLLGAEVVDAVDIDPTSVEVTRENAARNNVSFRAVVGEGVAALYSELTDPEAMARAINDWEQDEHPLAVAPPQPSSSGTVILGGYDVVISNIISRILIQIAPEVAQAVEPGGEWIVSGVIHQNWPGVLEAAEANGFSLKEKRDEGDWVGASFTKS